MVNLQLLIRSAVIIAGSLLVHGAMAQSPGPSRVQGSSTAADVNAKFKLPHAIELGEQAAPGKATYATFTPFPTGGGSLEVTVMRPDATIVKYRVDANHGQVINATEQTIRGVHDIDRSTGLKRAEALDDPGGGRCRRLFGWILGRRR
jgi:hypothetical protein